jgi:hypothetical protein
MHRYLIHNLTGSTIYYSDAAADHSTLVLRKKPHPLPNDCREELQVSPPFYCTLFRTVMLKTVLC